jgi:DNA-binding MarR family transcriptional regulator
MRHAEQLRYLILAAQREGNRRLIHELKPLGLTPAQSEALRIIGDGGSLTLSAVGEKLVCESGTNPSRIVDKLVDAGVVERVVDAADRRRVLLTLTSSGAALEKRVRSIENRMYDELDTLGAQPEVVALLSQLVAGSPSGAALANRAAR